MKDFKRLTAEQMGRYLRYYRNRAGFTAKTAAEVIGKTYQAIYRYERGASALQAEDMFRLLAAYSVDLNSAFTEPYELVDDPSRAKSSGSLRMRELMDVFAQLGEKEQKLVMQVARMALASMGSESGEKTDRENAELS